MLWAQAGLWQWALNTGVAQLGIIREIPYILSVTRTKLTFKKYVFSLKVFHDYLL